MWKSQCCWNAKTRELKLLSLAHFAASFYHVTHFSGIFSVSPWEPLSVWEAFSLRCQVLFLFWEKRLRRNVHVLITGERSPPCGNLPFRGCKVRGVGLCQAGNNFQINKPVRQQWGLNRQCQANANPLGEPELIIVAE